MAGFFDMASTVLLFVIVLTMYVAIPIILSYYLIKKKWMNDRLKLFFGIMLILNIVGYIVLALVKG